MKQDLLKDLFARVERAWFDRGDRTVARELIRQHPEFEEELREFSEDLILELEDEANVAPEVLETEDRVYSWLHKRGFDKALASARSARQKPNPRVGESPPSTASILAKRTPPAGPYGDKPSETLLMYLHQRTRMKRAEIASSLPNVTLEFLSLVSRYPWVVPGRVKLKLAQSIELRLNLPIDETLEHLATPEQPIRRAASRSVPAAKDPDTFNDLLDRAALTSAERRFWQECEVG